MSKVPQPQSPSTIKTYVSSYLGGYISGIAGEMVSLSMLKQLNTKGFTNITFSENCIASGIQQIAKDFTKNELKRHQYFAKLSKEHPFLFGACTGLPMWALTQLFVVPLKHIRRDDQKVFRGLEKSIRDDFVYHTFKNGLDELCIAKVFPFVLPNLSSSVTRKLVEGSVAGFVGGISHLLSWPYKYKVAKQTIPAAYDATLKAIPKVGVKKIVYSLAKPEIYKILP